MGKGATFKESKDTIDLFKGRFNKSVATRSKGMWSTIYKTIKNLETDEAGNIIPNSKNLKILRTVRGDIKKSIITPQYKKDLKLFLSGFDELKKINDTYYKAIASGTLNANKQVFNEVKNFSIEATKNSLLDSGITKEVIKPVENLLSQNVTSGGSFQDLTESLRTEILGDSQRLGKLERYAKQITTDSLNQFNANYNQTVSQDLGLEFYFYSGGLKDTSRAYCIGMIQGGELGLEGGRYYHKKEVENSADLQWAGKITGTNSSSIFINRGGYQCGHQWLAVDTLGVPKSARDRAQMKGYYTPKQT